MADKLDEILVELKEIKSEQKELKGWLYSEDGHKGDIPEIRELLSNHTKRIRILEIVVGGMIVSGGGAIALAKLLGG